MAVERPTFSESWYRVRSLRPRLRATVQAHRQHFRGRMWHVLQDPSSNQFFRLNRAAYHFVGLLDGERNVAEAWRICNEQLGDEAPTQGEAIQLLGQLYTSNLLQAELPPDTEGMFERYRKRIQREVQGYLTNILFARFPLYDPNRLLNRWVGIFGKVFTWPGFVVWLLIVLAGLYSIGGHVNQLGNEADKVLDPASLPLLYLAFVMIKLVHEFGHGFACKRMGRLSGTGGDVHTIGVMLLVFTPVPYVDASSAWAFRNKWQRVLVGAAGMYVELAVAALAAIVWANTAPGEVVHKLSYNVMFIASVSTLLFNGNPLLRYDAYYILSDLVEIPNLSQRSKDYIYYLVKRYVWGVKRARSSANTRGERIWFFFYGIASSVYRIFICVRILLFVADKLLIVGAIMALAAVVTWVLVPLGKFLRYLASSPELQRNRPRAVLTTVVTLAVVVVAVGLIPFDDHGRADGVVEPERMAVVYAGEDGFVTGVARSGSLAVPPETAVSLEALAGLGGMLCPGSPPVPEPPVLSVAYAQPVVRMQNPKLEASYRQLVARREKLIVQRRKALQESVAAAQAMDPQIEAVEEDLRWTQRRLQALSVSPPVVGVWISPELGKMRGGHVKQGKPVGMVADMNSPVIRATIDQKVAAPLIEEIDVLGRPATRKVEIRVMGRPDIRFTGHIVRISEAGKTDLPSRALGYAAGGSVETAPDDPKGIKAAEKFFEVEIRPDPGTDVRLLSGQRVAVRFGLSEKPLIAQWYRALLQLVQKRFRF